MACEHKSALKYLFYVHVSVGNLDILYVRGTKSLGFVDSLGMVTRIWSSYLVISEYSDYIEYHMMQLEYCGHMVVKGLAALT